MAINRAPWTALVDDDGSNLVGSVWNKAAIKTVLLDPIDAAIAPLVYGPAYVVPVFSVGQVDNISGGESSTFWIMSATVAMYITGIVAPAVDGTTHVLLNNGANVITIARLFGSTAANQFIGAGYANTDIPPWRALTIVYVAGLAKWVTLKP